MAARWVVCGYVGLVIGGSTGAADDERSALNFFESRIRPVLIDHCYSCHSGQAAKLKGGLRLDSREGLMAGGDLGPVVVPGSPDESRLVRAVEYADDDVRMPPRGRLPAPVVADLRKWVEMGIPFQTEDAARGGPESQEDPAEGSSEGGVWWSLRPLVEPVVPVEGGSHPAWGRTEIDAFVLAKLRERGLEPSEEADRATLIRRLTLDLLGLPPSPEEVAEFVADPSPGAYERLVDRLLASPHFGERWARHWMDLVHFAESHGHDQDRIRPHAWPYRDYLISAFNQDTPYGRLIEEQLAADLVVPGDPSRVVALGMIAAGPWDESSLRDIREDSIDRQIGRYLDRDDMVSTVMSTFASMTVHCARCHDHKFDPISQEDYYALQAVFAGVERANREFDSDPVIALRRRLLRLQRSLFPERAWLLEQHLACLPPPRLVYAAASEFAPDGGHRPPPGPREVRVLRRGDIHRPGAEAVPGALACVSELSARFSLEATRGEAARRAALARWLSDPRNPLTYRSIVNRLWQHHFGRGLVDTPNDFGSMGSPPSHPELLDFLAWRLIADGGSLKRIHRLIVTSAVYRQAVRHDPKAAAIDSENRLLWRMNRRRLDAESVRDSVLLISGSLDRQMGGPSVQQFTLAPGVHVTPVVNYDAYDWNAPGAGRRSVYRFLFRTLPDPFVEALDGADASQLTPVRTESASAVQALALLNNRFMVTHAERLAARLQSGADGLNAQIERAFQSILNRAPEPAELAELESFAREHGLANLCLILFNSNEFLYVN